MRSSLPAAPSHLKSCRTDPSHSSLQLTPVGGGRSLDSHNEKARVTMTSAAIQMEPVELEPPLLEELAVAEDDIVDLCGLGSFPASDPPSWWG
jgi:hypothetical protein